MGYEVHRFENKAGDTWYQVGKRGWFKIQWDNDWPWSSSFAIALPNRYETVEEAYDRVDELVLRDKVSSTKCLGPVGRPAAIESSGELVTYSMTPSAEEPPTVTETKPAKKPRVRKKK